MAAYEGIFPAIVTPMSSDGTINESAFREVMEFNIQAGVGGFWVAGGNGESVLLSDNENMRIADIASDQNRGRINNIMHVGAPTTKSAIKLAEHAAKAGAEAICCVPPFFYRQTDEAIVEHYKAVAASADLPFYVYNLPQSTGVEITVELMQKIQDAVPQLAGLKHSSINFANVREWVKMDLKCFIGSSMLMVPALSIGAVGCIDGPPCAAPELWVNIWKSWQAGDIDEAMNAQRKASSFTEIMREAGVHSGTKAVLTERLGIDCGSGRLPNPPLEGKRRENILQRVSDLGIGAVMSMASDD
ncbi:MAG: dihydrodipicolinate synthase family protein [SAR202 cluster bacterium]|jgi:N-acetylneuraminate lyase|nr:dihydrodipicolinate synthase family protein [SAR202 cluster bacterium]HJO60736.1 dihydrodipicolinate synthase family protein [SAR202 cluster bacterium]|tara:strand:+ start:809 stop:1714 length:906 start_codon:yes stop_codon:yes gene_type:complete